MWLRECHTKSGIPPRRCCLGLWTTSLMSKGKHKSVPKPNKKNPKGSADTFKENNVPNRCVCNRELENDRRGHDCRATVARWGLYAPFYVTGEQKVERRCGLKGKLCVVFENEVEKWGRDLFFVEAGQLIKFSVYED